MSMITINIKVDNFEYQTFESDTKDILEKSHELMDYITQQIRQNLNYDKRYKVDVNRIILQIGAKILNFLRTNRKSIQTTFSVMHDVYGEEVFDLSLKRRKNYEYVYPRSFTHDYSY